MHITAKFLEQKHTQRIFAPEIYAPVWNT